MKLRIRKWIGYYFQDIFNYRTDHHTFYRLKEQHDIKGNGVSCHLFSTLTEPTKDHFFFIALTQVDCQSHKKY